MLYLVLIQSSHVIGKVVNANRQRILTYFVRGSITVGMADLLFNCFGLICFATFSLATYLLVWLNLQQVKHEVSHTVILTLMKVSMKKKLKIKEKSLGVFLKNKLFSVKQFLGIIESLISLLSDQAEHLLKCLFSI